MRAYLSLRKLCPFFVLFALTVAVVFGEEPTEGPKPNRLINEKSAYLRQHAFNPVDWFPWGQEAFAKARAENKPIFLSIGYATCHWCHVMERESFSNPETAALLNANFVCIKVDREERPDVDRVYMKFVQATTGGGGWPLSVWLTPDLKPFFGGVYFAPQSQPGRPGFPAVLREIADQWTNRHDQLLLSSDKMLAELMADTPQASANGLPAVAKLRSGGLARAVEVYDAKFGGFEGAPKFPQAALLDFLLDMSATAKDAKSREQSLRMVLKTLREMAAGGIHDQLGGGFHRYTVDAAWRVPHFEKMLYIQAQLACVYLSAFQISGEVVFKDAARDTLDYVRRDMTDPAGGFFSAEDADSALTSVPGVHVEGAFYVWTQQEIDRLLGPSDAAIFDYAFGVVPSGNASTELSGKNILYRAHTAQQCAVKFRLSEEAVAATLRTASARLSDARRKRPRPQRDEKIIAAWNGLMISAFSRGAQVLGDPTYAVTAEKAAIFLREKLFDQKTGHLSRSFCANTRDDRGFAEDYAFVTQGLLDLYETSFDTHWLDWAVQLQEKQNLLFLDSAAGGYFANTADDATVLLRLKDDADTAEPSANSVSVRNLARLSEIVHRVDWLPLAERTAGAFGANLRRDPASMPLMLSALGWVEDSPKEILIQGEPASLATNRLINEVWTRFLPRRVLIRIDRSSRLFFASKMPVVESLTEIAPDTAMGYVCENFACQLPTSDPAEFARLLTAKPVDRR